jgi:hypothetical protein
LDIGGQWRRAGRRQLLTTRLNDGELAEFTDALSLIRVDLSGARQQERLSTLGIFDDRGESVIDAVWEQFRSDVLSVAGGRTEPEWLLELEDQREQQLARLGFAEAADLDQSSIRDDPTVADCSQARGLERSFRAAELGHADAAAEWQPKI